jgi:hypothetical protein
MGISKKQKKSKEVMASEQKQLPTDSSWDLQTRGAARNGIARNQWFIEGNG